MHVRGFDALDLLPQLEGHVVPDLPLRRSQWIRWKQVSAVSHHMPCNTASHLLRIGLGDLRASAALAFHLRVALQHFVTPSRAGTPPFGEDLREVLVGLDQHGGLAVRTSSSSSGP